MIKSAVFLIVFLTGPFALGQSSTSVTDMRPEKDPSLYAAAIETAILGKKGQEEQWLRLGHWKPRTTFIGRIFRSHYLSEVDGSDFFIHARGKVEPSEELRATLEAFASPMPQTDGRDDETKHPQCTYPARRQWAFQKLDWERVMRESGVPVLPCEARKKWKETLNAEGISLVFASAYLGNAASMFGHTFLKFHSRANRDGRDLLDYGVNFAAETGTDGGIPFALFGLTGGYKGFFTMQPYHQTLREYINLEGRDLWEYRLSFTPAQIDLFIDHLFELEKTYFDYYFLDENCSYFLMAAIEAARPDVDLTKQFWYEVIPADSIRAVTRAPGLVTGTFYRPSLATVFHAQAKEASSLEIGFARDVIEGDNDKRIALLASTNPKSGPYAAGVVFKGDSTRALDLALDYGGVLSAKDPKRFDPINHQIRAARASLGTVPRPVDLPTPTRPEEGHDPGRAGLIFEQPVGRPEGKNSSSVGAQLRFAYHDRLSRDEGYLRGTTLEVMRVTIMNDPYDKGRHDWRELTVLDILSAQPIDSFKAPLTWRAAFGVREPLLSRAIGPYANGGIGTTIGNRWIWLSALIDGEVLSNHELASQTPIYVGPRAIATFFLHPTFKVGIDAALMRPINAGPRIDTVSAEAVQSLSKNYEIRIGYSDTLFGGLEFGDQRRTQWTAKFFRHILF